MKRGQIEMRGNGGRRAWCGMVPLCFALVAGMLVGMLGLVAAVPAARAGARDTSGYTLTLQLLNGTSFSYKGSTQPKFQVILTVPAGTTVTNGALIFFDNTTTSWSVNYNGQSGNTYTFIFDGSLWASLPIGSHTAIASYPTASGPNPPMVQSSAVSFRITPQVTVMSCFINTPGYVFTAGSALDIVVQPTDENGTPDVPWQNATYTVSFTGPSTLTDANLVPDGNGHLAAKAPTTGGNYSMRCTFNGTDTFAPGTSGGIGVTISGGHQIGSVQIYTNPTTYSPYQACDMYIVFRAAPGGPTPSGIINITMGRNTTRGNTLGPDGTLLVHLGPLPNPSEANNQIVINYHGDLYYASANPAFSYTNPPIPGSGSTGGGSGNAGAGAPGQATTTPTPKSTATPTASATLTATETPTDASTINAVSSGAGDTGINPLVWLAAVVVLLGLGGGGAAGLVIYRTRRAKLPPLDGRQAPPFDSNATGE